MLEEIEKQLWSEDIINDPTKITNLEDMVVTYAFHSRGAGAIIEKIKEWKKSDDGNIVAFAKTCEQKITDRAKNMPHVFY